MTKAERIALQRQVDALPVTHVELVRALAELGDAGNQGAIQVALIGLWESGVKRVKSAKRGKREGGDE